MEREREREDVAPFKALFRNLMEGYKTNYLQPVRTEYRWKQIVLQKVRG